MPNQILKEKANIIIPRYFVCSAAILQFLIGGLRFSDGSILKTINQGLDINAEIFQNNPYSQYIWESPLKVFLLKILPTTSFLNLAFVFSALAIFPLLGVFWTKKSRFYQLSATLIVATTAFKISIQNIGTGDGLVSFLSILLILNFKNYLSSFIFILLIGLWHPGQSLFIAVSACIACLISLNSKAQFKENYFQSSKNKTLISYCISVLSGLSISRLLLIFYNNQLGFDYINRFDYLIERAPSFLKSNIVHSPIGLFLAFAYICFLCINKNIVRGKVRFITILWIIFCCLISLLTTDVSRVNILILTPVFVAIIDDLDLKRGFINFGFPLRIFSYPIFYMILLVSLIPGWGWSGLEFSLWSDFFIDACKYNVFCFS